MDRLTLKAVATEATDQGAFTAVISTSSVDREKDVVVPAAMVVALQKWNRPIPLAWNHSTAAEDIFGHIDPQSVKEVDGEVVAAGQVDLESKVGQEAWRSFKSGSIGFSFGYLIPDGGSTKRKGGGRQINELDVFEVTATPTPMNNDTRVLSVKAAVKQAVESEDPADLIDGMLLMAQAFIDTEPEAEDVAAMRDILARLQSLSDTEDTEDAPAKAVTEPKTVDVEDREPTRARPAHPSQKRHQEIQLEALMAGTPRRKSPPVEEVDEPEPASAAVLRRRAYDLTLQTLMDRRTDDGES